MFLKACIYFSFVISHGNSRFKDYHIYTNTHSCFLLVMATSNFRDRHAMLFYEVRMLKCTWLYILEPTAKQKDL